MKKLAAALALTILMLPVLPHSASARPDHDDHWRRENRHHAHGHDYNPWRHGHWYHGPHGGRHGWWWTVGSSWYFYNAPVYPYPDPYIPPAVAPIVAPISTGPALSFWYYCSRPRGYYPYVSVCARPWRAVLSY